ncbi:ATP-dependent Clp protease proteolytic subunit [Corynebacterium sp. UMB0012]|uniref:head maturation protease, ClpP-related n=1 Tax=Corynebacterium sp. UMB0012 TaxID=3046344 RepID=UPI00254ABD68|nr:head maturation protease, ClpP-related [Corynebacterium sp. UMB0012]MDK7049085.1 ATP-dependent Clp protease proteolytic subunit [Corynebacterium sp. UMB0012]
MNDLLIYGDIGWENTAKEVQEQLNEFDGGPVRVRINSGGGDVYEGIAILNTLRAYDGDITVVIESLAASAASFIAVGIGERVVIRSNAELMIHKAWTMLSGNSDDIDKKRDYLARQDMKLASIYAEKAGGELDDWLQAMSAETWYTAEEALEAGLVDAIEDAKKPVEAAAGSSRVFAQFRYSSRAAAPPPPVLRSESGDATTTPSDGQKGDTVSILNQLAQELGKKPEEVQNALSGFFNETVKISGDVDVTYPDDVKIVPTERITVDAKIGDTTADDEQVEVIPEGTEPQPTPGAVELAKSAGLTFTMGDVADGFEATVDEGGTVTVTAPSGAEVGSTAEFTVMVNDTAVPLSVTVRALSEDTNDGESAGEDAPAAPAGGEAAADVVTVPRAVWDEYMADRAKYSAKLAEDKRRALEAKVDRHIREGRYSAGHRAAAIAAYQTDPVAAEKIWGNLPKNVAVPVQEIGHSGDVAGMSKLEKLRAKAAANRQNKKENK